MQITQNTKEDKIQSIEGFDVLRSLPRSPLDEILNPATLRKFNLVRTEQPGYDSKNDLESPKQIGTVINFESLAVTRIENNHKEREQFLNKYSEDSENSDELKIKYLKRLVQDKLLDDLCDKCENISKFKEFVLQVQPIVECVMISIILFARLFFLTYEQLQIFNIEGRNKTSYLILTIYLIIQSLQTVLRISSKKQGVQSETRYQKLMIDLLGSLIDLLLLQSSIPDLWVLSILWSLGALNTLRIGEFFIKELDFLFSRFQQAVILYLIRYYILILLFSLISGMFDQVNYLKYKNGMDVEESISNICFLLGVSVLRESQGESKMKIIPLVYASFFLYCYQLISVLKLFMMSMSRKSKNHKHERDEKVLGSYQRMQLRRLKQVVKPQDFQKNVLPIFWSKKLSILKSLPDLTKIFGDQFLKQIAQIGKFHFNEHFLNFQQSNNLVILLKSRAFLETNLTQKHLQSEKIRNNILIGSSGFFTGQTDERQFRVEGKSTALSIDFNRFLQILGRYPLEKEKYHLFRHNLIFNEKCIFSNKCCACDQIHPTKSCPHISYQPKKNLVILKHLRSFPNERNKINSRKLKKTPRALSSIQLVQNAQNVYLVKPQIKEDAKTIQMSSDSDMYSVSDIQYQTMNQSEINPTHNRYILDELQDENGQLSRLSAFSTTNNQRASQLINKRKSINQLTFSGQRDSDVDIRATINKIQSNRYSNRNSQLPIVFEEDDGLLKVSSQNFESISPIKLKTSEFDGDESQKKKQKFPNTTPLISQSILKTQSMGPDQLLQSIQPNQEQQFMFFEEGQFSDSHEIDALKEYVIFFPQDNISSIISKRNVKLKKTNELKEIF